MFDLKFINFELAICSFAPIDGGRTIVDTLTIARQKFPGAPASLDALCKRFNIDTSTRTKHGALLDAELLADMYLELMGGSQSSLQFVSKKNSGQQSTESVVMKEPRPHNATPEEETAHAEFLKKIKNPLWLAASS